MLEYTYVGLRDEFFVRVYILFLLSFIESKNILLQIQPNCCKASYMTLSLKLCLLDLGRYSRGFFFRVSVVDFNEVFLWCHA